MLPELAKDPNKNTTFQGKNALKRKLRFFEGLIKPNYIILDVGSKNMLTRALMERYNIKIANTAGDLDAQFFIYYKKHDIKFDMIIYSHTIEHQFNPLYTLLRLKDYLAENGKLFVIMPEIGKLLWDKGHYHEIDDYRFKLLCKRAGFEIINKHKEKAWRHPLSYFTGFRAFYRLFREFDVYYTLKIDS